MMWLIYKGKDRILSRAMNSEKVFAIAEEIALIGDEEKTKKANDIIRLFVDGKIHYQKALKQLEHLQKT